MNFHIISGPPDSGLLAKKVDFLGQNLDFASFEIGPPESPAGRFTGISGWPDRNDAGFDLKGSYDLCESQIY